MPRYKIEVYTKGTKDTGLGLHGRTIDVECPNDKAALKVGVKRGREINPHYPARVRVYGFLVSNEK